MVTVMIVVAAGCVFLAIVMAIAKKVKGTTEVQEPVGSQYFASQAAKPIQSAVQPTKPFPPPPARVDRKSIKKSMNRKGWRAPNDYYFNDADELVSITGSFFVDAAIIAGMCNEQYTAPVEECTASASCCSEASAETVHAVGGSYDDGGGDDYGGDDGGSDD